MIRIGILALAHHSLNAARAIGVSSRKGSLEARRDADLVLLDGAFHVSLTVAQGEVVYQGPPPKYDK